MVENDDFWDGFKRHFDKYKKLTPQEALAGMRRAISDLAGDDENRRSEYAKYLRQRMEFITKNPEKKMAPEEPKMLKFLLALLRYMEIESN